LFIPISESHFRTDSVADTDGTSTVLLIWYLWKNMNPCTRWDQADVNPVGSSFNSSR